MGTHVACASPLCALPVAEHMIRHAQVHVEVDPCTRCCSGLFTLCQFPNYFGEMACWIVMCLWAGLPNVLPSYPWIIISPIFITGLLRFVSGAPSGAGPAAALQSHPVCSAATLSTHFAHADNGKRCCTPLCRPTMVLSFTCSTVGSIAAALAVISCRVPSCRPLSLHDAVLFVQVSRQPRRSRRRATATGRITRSTQPTRLS